MVVHQRSSPQPVVPLTTDIHLPQISWLSLNLLKSSQGLVGIICDGLAGVLDIKSWLERAESWDHLIVSLSNIATIYYYQHLSTTS